MANSQAATLDRSFVAVAHPLRREILERLAQHDELTVGEATHDFPISKPAISKHLKVLEEAGAIVRVIDGRTHRLRLNGDSFEDAYAWLARQRELWERKLDVVEEFLKEQQSAAGTPNTPRTEDRA
ncbi:MAG TPA: metalloregulator ArsR/SmtB family transcription factor [Conexibacter sp.]|jgi:DNA-binding transcriptional ArsR family regulator|nr:metalloregulator ArsR/SmtB family transcription factor [Conexibacter sp.]